MAAEELGPGRLDRRRFEAIDPDGDPEDSPPELAGLPDDFWDNAVMVPPAIKKPISIRLDSDVLEWFRGQGPRYQTRINAVLRSYMEHRRGTEG